MNDLSFMDLPTPEQDVNNSAPYVAVQPFFPEEKPYRGLYSEWRCDIDTVNTYYNVFNFYRPDYPGCGYAGFQNVNGGHIVIFSMWDTPTCCPRVDYCIPGARVVNFGREGTGISIRARFDYREKEWYAMHLNAMERDGRTYYTLYAKPLGRDWEMIGQISYPMVGIGILYESFFLEDFACNGLTRAQSMRNMYAIRQDGASVPAGRVYVRHADSKQFRTWNKSLCCSYHAQKGMISIVSGNRRISYQQTFPNWVDL